MGIPGVFSYFFRLRLSGFFRISRLFKVFPRQFFKRFSNSPFSMFFFHVFFSYFLTIKTNIDDFSGFFPGPDFFLVYIPGVY